MNSTTLPKSQKNSLERESNCPMGPDMPSKCSEAFNLDLPEETQALYNACSAFLSQKRHARIQPTDIALKARKIAKIAKSLSYDSDESFFKSIQKGSMQSISALESLLLRPHPSFFEGAGMFRTMSDILFPELLNKSSEQNSLNFWVPGCEDGKEAYSLALFLNSYRETFPNWHFHVCATDTSSANLAIGEKGKFGSEEIEDIIFCLYGDGIRKTKDELFMKREVRETVSFTQGKFYDFKPERAPFDCILFRNHLHFWHPDLQEKIIKNLAGALRPGGYLILGSKESLMGISDDFKPVLNTPGFYSLT